MNSLTGASRRATCSAGTSSCSRSAAARILSLLVTADQRARLREQIFKWRDQGKPIFLGDFWNDGCFVGGCIAGARYYFHIYANGDISPCVFAPIACGEHPGRVQRQERVPFAGRLREPASVLREVPREAERDLRLRARLACSWTTRRCCGKSAPRRPGTPPTTCRKATSMATSPGRWMPARQAGIRRSAGWNAFPNASAATWMRMTVAGRLRDAP